MIEGGATEWSLADRLIAWLEAELGTTQVLIQRSRFPAFSDSGWELAVRRDDQEPWSWIAAWARLGDDVVRRLGHDPGSLQGIGAGVGLERIASLRYGIDDIRKVVAWRVDE